MCCGLKAYPKDMWLCPECTSCISRRGFAIWWIRRAKWRGRLVQMLVSAESSELPCKCDASSSGTENFFEKHLNWQAYDIVNMQLAPPCRYSGWNVVFDPYTLTTGKIYHSGRRVCAIHMVKSHRLPIWHCEHGVDSERNSAKCHRR